MSKEMPLVTIVVPVFNLGFYIDKCVASLLAQTYENIEIVLVDDGSNDDSLARCKQHAEKSTKIKVFHQENAGAGAARNYGRSKASGEFLMFVDGDDAISNRSVELMMKPIIESNANMAIGGFMRMRPEEMDKFPSVLDGRYELMPAYKCLIEMMYGQITEMSACGKIAKTNLWAKFSFPEDSYYEDLAVMSSIIAACDSVALVSQPLYAYVMRPGSKSSKTFIPAGRANDYLNSLNKCTTASELAFPVQKGMSDAVRARRMLEMSRIYRLCLHCEESNATENIKAEALSYIRENLKSYLSDSKVSKIWKLRIIILAICPAVYPYAFSVATAIKGKRFE